MALSDFLIKIVVYLIVTSIFVLINAILLREIVKMFNIKDNTVATATAISIWMGSILLVFSFLSEIRIIGWIVTTLVNIGFIYLIKKYYQQAWTESLLIWETWTAILIYVAIFIYGFSQSYLTLIGWGLVPLGINLVFILFMKIYKNSIITIMPANIMLFLVINLTWLSVFKLYFPI